MGSSGHSMGVVEVGSNTREQEAEGSDIPDGAAQAELGVEPVWVPHVPLGYLPGSWCHIEP